MSGRKKDTRTPPARDKKTCLLCGTERPATEAFCPEGCKRCAYVYCKGMLRIGAKVCTTCGRERGDTGKKAAPDDSHDRGSKRQREDDRDDDGRGDRVVKRDKGKKRKEKKRAPKRTEDESEGKAESSDSEGEKDEEELRKAAKRLRFISLASVKTKRMRDEDELRALVRGGAPVERKLSLTASGELLSVDHKRKRDMRIDTFEQAAERFETFRRAVRAAHPTTDLPDLMETYWDTIRDMHRDGVSLNALLRCDAECRSRWTPRGSSIETRVERWGSVHEAATTTAKTSIRTSPYGLTGSAARGTGAAAVREPTTAAVGTTRGATDRRRRERGRDRRREAPAESEATKVEAKAPRARHRERSPAVEPETPAPKAAGLGKGAKPCRFWPTARGCDMGTKCLFKHDPEALKKKESASSSARA